MKFLKPERASYLNEFVKNVKIGSPNVDPYLLVVKHENLTYKDFVDLPAFLKWRYDDMGENEAELISSLFRNYGDFSIRTLEMQIQRATASKNYVKLNRSLYEHVAINSREIAKNLKAKNTIA